IPLDWSGPVEIRSGLDGAVENHNVARYRPLRGDHLVISAAGHAHDIMWLVARTRQSRRRLAQVARTTLVERDDDRPVTRARDTHDDRVEQVFALDAAEGRPIAVEKIV